MITQLSARREMAIWLEDNDPMEFLRAHEVVGDGQRDLYHMISMDAGTGNIFYRKTPEIGQDDKIIDVIGIHDGERLDGLGQLSQDEIVEMLTDEYVFKYMVKGDSKCR